MFNWENFEIACANYLRENFGEVAEFEEYGGSDSTTPDILVKCAIVISQLSRYRHI